MTVGGGAVVLAVALGAAVFVVRHDRGPKARPPASVGGLVVQMGRTEDAKLDPKKPLRCFVNGQLEGLETLGDCAKKNGVATEALDVGVDQTGALAAAQQGGSNLTPLPPAEGQGAADQSLADGGSHRPSGECWRYAGGAWRKAGDGLALNACVQLLFAGHCEKPGGASYGRWMGQTVRLVPHRVEISADNKSFRPVVDQADATCQIPDF
ncbi:MAG: hypothetical protein P4L73_14725 [Caulobacteraceae bacterium]|nr:hypothetical protein [Caulobacteraceae bacterium]